MQAAIATDPWELQPDARRAFDPLLTALVQISGLLGRPSSPDALTAGLPISAEDMTPELFVRAAAQAGLSARVVQRPLEEIQSLVLPAVLLLKGRQACVLVAHNEANEFQLLLPESGGTRAMTLAELALEYAGFAIFVQ